MKIYNKEWFLLFGILCWICLIAQESKEEIRPFRLTKVELKQQRYPWADELYLTYSGVCVRHFDGGNLVISVHYNDQRIAWKRVPLQYKENRFSKDIQFSEEWGPINLPHQYPLAGEYVVKLSISSEHQPFALKQKVEELLKNKNVANDEKKIFWGNSNQYDEEEEKIQTFYVKRIQEVQSLHKNLMKHIKLGLTAPAAARKNNSHQFVEDQKFAVRKWRAWLYSNIEVKFKQEKEIFEQFYKHLLARRHPKAKANIELYYRLLERLKKLYVIEVYEKNGLRPQQQDMDLDPLGINRKDILEKNLQRLVQETIADLKIERQMFKK